MGFVMDGLDAEAYDREYSDRTLLNRIAQYFRPHAGRMALGAGAISLDSLLGAGLPVIVSETPQLAVVLGSGKALDELRLLKEVTVS